MSPTDAVANAEAILTAARGWRPTLMVGPLPVGDAAADRRIADLSSGFAALCARLGVPYLSLVRCCRSVEYWGA